MRTSWMATMRRVVAACACAALTTMSVSVVAAQDRLAGVRHAPEGAPVQLTLRSGGKIVGALVRVSGDEVTIREGEADENADERQAPAPDAAAVQTFNAADLKDARVIMPMPVLPDSPRDRAAEAAATAPSRTSGFEKGNYLVRTTDGLELGGQLERLDRNALRIRVGSQAWDMPLDQVVRVERRGDSVKNGAILGGIVGAIVAVAQVPAAAFLSDGDPVFVIGMAAANVALVALIGAGIDKAISPKTTIYQRPGIALAPTRGGVGVSFHVPLGR